MAVNPLDQSLSVITDIFNLRRDTDEVGTVDNIRKNVDFQSANAWTLVFAIFVASIGLNVNSAAVIIGAMLISPLMGPILGFGLALGINDGELLRRSLRNLAIAVVISVLTSTLYFLLSPLHDAQSELLARTQPTFYDVMIAFFGGAAGIVSISRKERGAAVAGVAIATALMPPLCTAGYALSNGNFKFLLGALYLFLINSVFIGLSTFLFVRYLHFKKVRFQNEQERKRVRIWISTIVVVIVLPSLILAWMLMQESRFRVRSEKFVREQFQFKNSFVVSSDLKYRYSEPQILVNVIGVNLTPEQIESVKSKLPIYHLEETKLEVRQISDVKQATGVDSELVQLRQTVAEHDTKIEELANIGNELKVLYPEVVDLLQSRQAYVVVWKKRIPKATLEHIEAFLKVRSKNQNIIVSHSVQI